MTKQRVKTVGKGRHIFQFDLSRLVTERLVINVRSNTISQARRFLRNHETDLEGKWETYDKTDFEFESFTFIHGEA